MKTLKMVFTLEAGANVTYTLQDPKADLTLAGVKSVMQEMIDKKAVANGDALATGIKDAYIYESSRQELV